jgi:hypothetical protein
LQNGSYYLTAFVEGIAGYAETSFSNNLATSANPITYTRPLVNLTGTVLSAPTAIAAGRAGLLTLEIGNSGNVLAHGVMIIGLYASTGTTFDAKSAISLGTVRIPMHLQPGHSVKVGLHVKPPLSIADGGFYLVAWLNQIGSINNTSATGPRVVSDQPTTLG